ncbi:MAG: hypothetical protein J7K15_02750 [Deltaproteobacteria bacterium]|nr:hypothetical protein [Deltaproteobacteria bacterium]
MLTTVLTKGPEKVFIVVVNDEGATLPIGTPLEWKCDGTRDGIDVQAVQTAAKKSLVVGLAAESIPDGTYGLCQVYGVMDNARIYAHGTATNSNVAIGDIFVASTAQSALTAVDAGSVISKEPPMFVAMETVASASVSTISTTAKVFVRCM